MTPDHAPPAVPLKILSFCTGCGGLDLGLERANVGTVAFKCEKDPVIRQTIRHHHPEVPLHDDLLNLDAATLRTTAQLTDGDEILSVGGVPCPSFSTAGKRKSLDDPRGACLMRFFELSFEVNARYIVLENVRGLLSAARKHRVLAERGPDRPQRTGDELPGGVLRDVVAMLEGRGYHVSYHLYDATRFGVPQARERVILVAVRGRPPVPLLTPTHAKAGNVWGLPALRTLGDAIRDLEDYPAHVHTEFPEKRMVYFRKLTAGQNWRHLHTDDQEAAMGPGTFKAGGGKSGVLRRLDYNKPSPTLTCSPTMNTTAMCHPVLNRPLSIQEFRRIQGFPDDFVVKGSVSKQYKQFGNAVPVPLAEAVGRTIGRHWRGEPPLPVYEGFRFSRYKAAAYCTPPPTAPPCARGDA